MSVEKITSIAQFDTLFESDKIFFVDFYADRCGPCRQISPIFEKLAEENSKEGVEFYKLNIDEIPQLANALGIQSIPTFHAYKEKKRLNIVGADRSTLATFVQTSLDRL